MIVRWAILGVLGLITSVVLLPVSGDVSTARWLVLAALTGLVVPLSIYGTVRLLFPTKRPVGAWAAFSVALFAEVGLLVAAFTALDVGARDIGTSVGRAARGEGLPPGGIPSGKLGQALGLAFAQTVTTKAEDYVHRVAFGRDGLVYAAGLTDAESARAAVMRGAGSGARGKLLLLGYDAAGVERRRATLEGEGDMAVVALAADIDGTARLVVRSMAAVELGGAVYGRAGIATTLFVHVDKQGLFTAPESWDLASAVVAVDENGTATVAGYADRSFTVDGVDVGARGLVVIRRDKTGALLATRHFPGVGGRIEAVASSSRAVFAVVGLSRPHDAVDLGEGRLERKDGRAFVVALDPNDLSTRAVLSTDDGEPLGAALLPDGQLLVVLRAPPPDPGAPAPPPKVLGEETELFAGPTYVLALVSSSGEVAARLPVGEDAARAGPERPLLVAADEAGALLVLPHQGGLRAGELRLAPPPPPPRLAADSGPALGYAALRIDDALTPAFLQSLDVGSAPPTLDALVTQGDRALVGGALTEATSMLGGPLARPDGDTSSSGFVALLRIQ